VKKLILSLLLLCAAGLFAQNAMSESHSTGLTTYLQVKGFTRLYDATMYNRSGVTLYMMLIDTNGTPATGAVPISAPIMLTTNNPTGSYSYRGKPFVYGITLCASTTDNTLTLVSSNACHIDISYNP
jgi:hypothetical protein